MMVMMVVMMSGCVAARQSSYALCLVAVLFSMVQGGGIARLTKRSGSEYFAVVLSLFLLSSSLAFWALAFSIPSFLLSLVPISFSSGVLHTLINSLVSQHTKSHEIGGAS